jgi:hypothetical protein
MNDTDPASFLSTHQGFDWKRADADILNLIGNWLIKTYFELDPRNQYYPDNHICADIRNRYYYRGLCMWRESFVCGCPLHSTAISSPSLNSLVPEVQRTSSSPPRCGTSSSEFDDGDDWEKDSKEEYWNAMIRHGATVERFLNTSDSAWSIVDNIVEKNNQKEPLLFQEERVDQKKHFARTSAWEALYLNLGKLMNFERQTNMMRGLDGRRDSNGSGTHSPIKSS